MTSYRVRVKKPIVQQLREMYNNKIMDEFNTVPSDSVIVTIALLELQAMKKNQELEIKFNKNGKFKYKLK